MSLIYTEYKFLHIMRVILLEIRYKNYPPNWRVVIEAKSQWLIDSTLLKPSFVYLYYWVFAISFWTSTITNERQGKGNKKIINIWIWCHALLVLKNSLSNELKIINYQLVHYLASWESHLCIWIFAFSAASLEIWFKAFDPHYTIPFSSLSKLQFNQIKINSELIWACILICT